MCITNLLNSKKSIIEIKSIEDYIKEVNKLGKGTKLFRGQSDKAYPLLPQIGRNSDYHAEKEKQLFLDFKRHYYLYSDNRPKSDMDLLFLAQHYSLPTRMLDWTYNPLIALYFACQGKPDKVGSVFVYNIGMEKGEKVIEGHDLDNNVFSEESSIREPVFLIPDYTERRFLNQKGMFLWFKNPTKPFEDYNCRIEVKNKSKIKEELSLFGITDSFVYTDLDHLCLELKTKYSQ